MSCAPKNRHSWNAAMSPETRIAAACLPTAPFGGAGAEFCQFHCKIYKQFQLHDQEHELELHQCSLSSICAGIQTTSYLECEVSCHKAMAFDGHCGAPVRRQEIALQILVACGVIPLQHCVQTPFPLQRYGRLCF